MMKRNRLLRRLIAMGIASVVLVVFGVQVTLAQDVDAATAIANVQVAVDASWILVSAFLVFFMQAGFAFLESGMIRQNAVVNSLMENFMDACLGGLAFFAVGYGIAFGTSSGGLFGSSNFFLNEAMIYQDGGVIYGEGISMFVLAIFQFAFAATAGTIATGAMAERTNFVGKIIYTVIVAAIIYPVVVHWIWGGGWLAERGFMDFAGSTVVHLVGAIIGLVGAIMVGPRVGRVWGKPPRAHHLGFATLGTMILWFGWYGFNPGSALGMGDNGLVGLVAVNTTLAACAGATAAVFFAYIRTGKWDLPAALNGSLGGLVGITAGCAFVSPSSSVLIGAIGGVLVLLTLDVMERIKIDDAVGAFAVHGVCGAMGTLAIGLIGQPELGANSLLLGGSADQLITQVIGIVAACVWVSITSVIMFAGIKAIGKLRISAKADAVGIDVYEHGASVWPDVLPHPDDVPAMSTTSGTRASAPAAGD
jgi:Amt family ammonium transporter